MAACLPVAPHVNRHNLMGAAECIQQVSKRIPTFWETMEAAHEGISCLNCVEPVRVGHDKLQTFRAARSFTHHSIRGPSPFVTAWNLMPFASKYICLPCRLSKASTGGLQDDRMKNVRKGVYSPSKQTEGAGHARKVIMLEKVAGRQEPQLVA